MGYKLGLKENQDISMFLKEIESDSQKIEDNMLRLSGDFLRDNVIKDLRHIQSRDKRYKNRPHLADEVRRSLKKGRYGDRYVSVSGGKKTGSLWHIVNDGTYRTRATHFMDNALKTTDKQMPNFWEETLNKLR